MSSQLSHLSGVNGTPLGEACDAINTNTANSRLPPIGVKGGSASGDIDQFSSNKPVVVRSIDTHRSSQSVTIKQVTRTQALMLTQAIVRLQSTYQDQILVEVCSDMSFATDQVTWIRNKCIL